MFGKLFKFGAFGCLIILAAVGALVVIGVVLISAAISTNNSELNDVLTGDARDVTLKIDGTPGLQFSGNIGSPGSSRSVDGVVPQTFTLPGDNSSGLFTAVIQKKAEGGQLIVGLDCSGDPVAEETTAAFGVVTVTCSPN